MEMADVLKFPAKRASAATYRRHGHAEEDVVVPDPLFAHPRLAAIYDFVDDDRSDLDVYVDLVREFGATSVLDIGCGTGTLACQLARFGKDVVGLDPASASLDVARRKSFGERVRWVHGDVSRLPVLTVDLVTMTGNVAQVFLADAEWTAVLTAARAVMRSEGRLVFETRDPAQRAWERWTKDESYRRVEVPEVGPLESWVDVTAVELPYVSFRHTFLFWADGTELTSDSTLRFRSRDEIAVSLDGAGFQVCEVRDAPDRPGLEMVFIARCQHSNVTPEAIT
jgi:SAM-dependent methyltransferase